MKIDLKLSLHHETIYRYILKDKAQGGMLYHRLRHKNKPYRKRYGANRVGKTIPNRIDIDDRPKVVNERSRIGDWEADTIIGHQHKGAILTLDERKSKIKLAYPLNRKTANNVALAMIDLLSSFKAQVKTITFDNGKEFCAHEKIAKTLECDNYFAKPYHSWERGQNENNNGLLRHYFPKSRALNNIELTEVYRAIHKMNHRPKKCLNYQTPYEVFKAETGIDLSDWINMHL